MLPKEREQKIINLINEKNGCTVTELSKELDVSETTIRRDLQTLEEQNLINRTHGGATPIINRNQPYENRKISNLEQKKSIGKRAAEEIHQEQMVLFDSGSTLLEVAKQVPTDLSFECVTPMPSIAHELSKGDCSIHLTGGTYSRENSTCIGPWTEKKINQLGFDLLILGIDGISEKSLSARNLQQHRLKELMVEKSERVILVADHSKFYSEYPFKFTNYKDVDLFITDKTIPTRIRDQFESLNIDMIEGIHS